MDIQLQKNITQTIQLNPLTHQAKAQQDPNSFLALLSADNIAADSTGNVSHTDGEIIEQDIDWMANVDFSFLNKKHILEQNHTIATLPAFKFSAIQSENISFGIYFCQDNSPEFYQMSVLALNVLVCSSNWSHSSGDYSILTGTALSELPKLETSSNSAISNNYIGVTARAVTARSITEIWPSSTDGIYKIDSQKMRHVYCDARQATLAAFGTAEFYKDLRKKSIHLLATDEQCSVLVMRDQSLSEEDSVNLEMVAWRLTNSLSGLNIRRVIINGQIIIG